MNLFMARMIMIPPVDRGPILLSQLAPFMYKPTNFLHVRKRPEA